MPNIISNIVIVFAWVTVVTVLMLGHIIGAGLGSFLLSSSGWVENIFYLKKGWVKIFLCFKVFSLRPPSPPPLAKN